jgi:hypothetical protein
VSEQQPAGYVAVWRTAGKSPVLRANLHVWETKEAAWRDMSRWEHPGQYELMALVPLDSSRDTITLVL